MKKPQRGQAMTEAVLALPLAVLSLGFIAGLALLILNALVVHHSLYELLVCRQMLPTNSRCQELTERQLQDSLLIGQLQNIKLVQDPQSAEARAEVLFPWQHTVTWSESIRLPLPGTSP